MGKYICLGVTPVALTGTSPGTEAFSATCGGAVISSWLIVGTGDFNSDGKPDLVWRNSSSGQSLIWYMNGAAYQSTVAISPMVADTNWTIAAIADFNSDSKPNLVWRNTATGQNSLWYMNNNALSSAVTLPAVSNTSYTISGAADFNGDTKPDLVWRNRTNGQNSVWYMNDNVFSSAVSLPSVSNTLYMLSGSADFNNDVRPDLVWRNLVTGQNSLWYMNDATYISSVSLLAAN